MLIASASDQWWISDEYTTFSNQNCHNIVFANYCIWLISDDLISNLESTCVDEFY
jgi:hypothetical protein